MPRIYEEEKADIQKIILYAKSLRKSIWIQITILYNIPYKRLLARANGRGNRFQNGGHSKVLSIEQEIVLIRVIDRIKFNGIYYRLSIISNIANFLLRKAHDNPEIELFIIGKFWTARSAFGKKI
jgi:hypothetical protein